MVYRPGSGATTADLPEMPNPRWVVTRVAFMVVGMAGIAYCTSAHSYMGNFDFQNQLLYVVVGLLITVLAGLLPTFLIYRRYRKRWVFALTPFLGALVLLALYQLLSLIFGQ